MATALIWPPIYKAIEDRLTAKDPLCLLMVSFIKIDALKQLLWAADHCKKLKVVVRWRVEDIVSGVSDLEVYEFLKERKVPLYYNEKIHLKLYIFESDVAFNASGNLTLKGLGYSPVGNIEVGSMVTLGDGDWREIYELIDESTPVDDDVFKKMMDTIKAIPPGPASIPLPSWPPVPRKLFTIQVLPATENVDYLITFYASTDHSAYSGEEKQRAMHDLIALKVPEGLDQQAARDQALATFKATAFVKAFVTELKSCGSMSFGAVSAWVHDKCEDVPVPYRWEIKKSVGSLYNWLAAAYPEITWDRPVHSQVIYWKP